MTPEQAQQLAHDQLEDASAGIGAPGSDVPSPEEALAAQRAAGVTELPHEQVMDQMMARFAEQYDSLAAQVKGLEAQLAQARTAAAVGSAPDHMVMYANQVKAKFAIHRIMNHDVPGDTFDRPDALATSLVSAAEAASADHSKASELAPIVDAIDTWVSRTYQRLHRKPIDWSSLLYDAEMVAETAAKLAA